MKKGSKLYSILSGTCPRCQQESMYQEPNPYKVSDIFKMHDRCSHCHTKYKMEPSFFYGAMYVSYAVGVAFSVAVFVISFLMVGASLPTTFIAIIVTLIILMPVIMRLSRNIWINFFINYDPDSIRKPGTAQKG